MVLEIETIRLFDSGKLGENRNKFSLAILE